MREPLVFDGLPGTFHVADAGRNISVTWTGPGGGYRQTGTAGADFLDWADHWWVARVIVQDPGMRSKGIGGKLVGLMLDAIKKNGTGKRVIVAPGGYGADESKQFAFYRRQGFVDSELGKEVLEWRP